MNKEEVVRLKEKIRADYERKLQAIELVEDMLAEATPEQPVPLRQAQSENSASGGTTTALLGDATDTIDDRIEVLFRQHPGQRWSVPLLAAKLEVSNRSTVWGAVKRLVEAGRVKLIASGKGRRAAQYAWASGDNGKIENAMN